MMNNSTYSGNEPTPYEVERRLQDQLPPNWRVSLRELEPRRGPDAILELGAPDGRCTTLLLDVKRRLEPAAVARVLEQIQSWAGRNADTQTTTTYLVAAGYLSERTRSRLRESSLNYLDFTGNTYLCLEEPGVYVFTQGANKDPDRASRPARSLRGVKAAKVVRTLADLRAPLGVRQIAQIAETDPGNVSRLLDFLERQDLVRRTPDGAVEEVLWDQLLQEWTRSYSVLESNRAYNYLDPRGVDDFVDRLKELPANVSYAVTGSLAAGRWAPVAPARLAAAFVRDAPATAAALGLVPVDVGANVVLMEPKGDFVFDRTIQDEGVTYVAPSQALADLMTGPGRNPAEADALLDWMRRNEGKWRD